MKSRMTRNKVFEALGAKPTNPRWSWCALAPDHSRAVFTLWEDEIKDGQNNLFWDDYDVKGRLGEMDQKRTLELVINKQIPAYGLICIARDVNATPRSIKEIKAEYLVKLRIIKVGKGICGKHLQQIHLIDLIKSLGTKNSENSGLNDLAIPSGNATPDRALSSSYSVIRDPEVRDYVIKKSAGMCEYCGKKGFLMRNGRHYVEAHHIIALANQGKDTVENVIALCPEHHREAHYGAEAEALEMKFVKCIQQRK